MYPDKLNATIPAKTHYMSMFRRNYLERVLSKMNELMESHLEMFNTAEWYDGLFYNEDAEETLGFVFVACQTFIAGTIADTYGKDKEKAMKNAPQLKRQRTKIELINAVANYYKHKDEGSPLGETKKILNAYKLLDEEFPINAAFELLAEDYKIGTLSQYLYDWSNHLHNELIDLNDKTEKDLS